MPISRATPLLRPPETRVLCLDEGGLAEIAAHWWRLWHADPAATPFLSPAWILTWARHYAPGRFFAETAWRDDELVALLPLFRWRDTIYLAGTGHSDYGGALFAPGATETAAELLAVALAVVEPGENALDMQQLSPDSPLLTGDAPKGWMAVAGDGDPCSIVPVEGADGMVAATRKLRANLRAALRRIAAAGGVVELTPPREIAATVRALEQLHQARWRERGEPGMLADLLLRGFVHDVAPVLAAAGLLRLYRLRFDAEVAGVLFALVDGRAQYFYLAGFDPRQAWYSPGTALFGAALGQAAREGQGSAHFLRGREAYKQNWGARDLRLCRRRFMRA